MKTSMSTLHSSNEGFHAPDIVDSNGGGGSGRNSASTTPNRKRLYPTSFISEDEVPPNKRIHTPTEEEKETLLRERQVLYKRLLDSEKNPFLLSYSPMFPFLPMGTKGMSPVSPVYSFLQQQQQQQLQAQTQVGNSLHHVSVSPGSNILPAHMPACETHLGPANAQGSLSNLSMTGLLTPGGSSVGSSSTPPRVSYPTQLLNPANFLKYPFSPPTPSSLNSLSLLSPWNNSNLNLSSGDAGSNKPSSQDDNSLKVSPSTKEGNSLNVSAQNCTSSKPHQEKDNCGSKSSVGHTQSSVPRTKGSRGGLLSASSSIAQLSSAQNASIPSVVGGLTSSSFASQMPVQSPLGYFHHPSPLSPMMLLNSPYASSLSSVPSLNSSSGCSSVSDNSVPSGSVSSHNHSYAPSEYHVGPQRPLVEKIAEELDNQSEGASNSGRNTPIDVGMENNSILLDEVSGATLAQRLAASTSATPAFNVGDPTSRVVATALGNSSPGVSSANISSPSNRPPSRNHQVPYPFSVESLSSSVNSQGYPRSRHVTDRPSSGVSSMSSSVSSRDSTPDPDEMKHHTHSRGIGCDTFCLVPGRLSLLSSTQKYQVSVDEVRRRLSHPECLNASVLGGILRRAKSKNGGHVLRQRLETIGVTLPPGRRKATDLSLFTSLVEGEALHLANDFHRLCDNSFPHAELAQIIASQHSGTPEAQHRISMVKATQLIVSELQAMINAVGGPSNIRPNNPNNPYPGLMNFSLLTHGFGNPTINTSLGALQTYLQDLLAFYEGSKLPQPEPRHMYTDNKLPQQTSQSSVHTQHPSHSTAYHPHPESGLPGTIQYNVNNVYTSSSDNALANNISCDSTSNASFENVNRSRSGLFVCLKQEPSD